MRVSRRKFLGSSATLAAAAGTAGGAVPTKELEDGPRAGGFSPLPIAGNTDFDALAGSGLSDEMGKAVAEAPRGHLVCWGLPFEVGRPVVLRSEVVTEKVAAIKTEWLVFLHTTDGAEQARDEHGLITSRRGQGFLGETVAEYVIVYADGTAAPLGRELLPVRPPLETPRRPTGS